MARPRATESAIGHIPSDLRPSLPLVVGDRCAPAAWPPLTPGREATDHAVVHPREPRLHHRVGAAGVGAPARRPRPRRPAGGQPAGDRRGQGPRARPAGRAQGARRRRRGGQGRRRPAPWRRLAADVAEGRAGAHDPPGGPGARRQVRRTPLRRDAPGLGGRPPDPRPVGPCRRAAVQPCAAGLLVTGVPALVAGRPDPAARPRPGAQVAPRPSAEQLPSAGLRRHRGARGRAQGARPAAPGPARPRRAARGPRRAPEPAAVGHPVRDAAAAPRRGARRGGERQDVAGARAGTAAHGRGAAGGPGLLLPRAGVVPAPARRDPAAPAAAGLRRRVPRAGQAVGGAVRAAGVRPDDRRRPVLGDRAAARP